MASISPLICWVLIFLVIWSNQQDWRNSYLTSLLIWAVILTGLTETLSVFQLLNFQSLLLFWLLLSLGIGIFYYRRILRSLNKISLESVIEFSWFRDLSRFNSVLVTICFVFVLILGFLAVYTAPNNWDSMIYHLSRVVYWQQHQSVAHYPTHTLSQLYQNPWAEFAILHLQILSRSDRLANLVQWGAMVSSLIGISLITRQLGGKVKAQIFAVIFCFTLPMGILQASSTQNDYAVSLWLVCLAYFVLRIIKQGITLENTAFLGASLGLAILTKGTAYIYALPFCLWIAAWGIRTLGWYSIKPALMAIVIALTINLGHYTRNFYVFASPLGLGGEETHLEFNIRYFLANTSKHLSLHADIIRNLALDKLITPTTGITNKLVQIIHEQLDVILNPSANNPFYVPSLSRHEDTAGNPLHLVFILVVCSLIFIINRKLWKNPILWQYFLAVLTGFLLFCWLIFWSHWRARLHLPFFVLGAPWVAVVITQSFNNKITNFTALCLLILCSSWIFNNGMKPILGEENVFVVPRINQYFKSRQYIQPEYIQAANIIQQTQCQSLGIIDNTSGKLYEYPMLLLLKSQEKDIEIRHVSLNHFFGEMMKNQKVDSDFEPCILLAFASTKNQQTTTDLLTFNRQRYEKFWDGKYVELYGMMK